MDLKPQVKNPATKFNLVNEIFSGLSLCLTLRLYKKVVVQSVTMAATLSL